MNDYKKMADVVFKNINLTCEDIENKYPKRNLPSGAMVTRFAPSPTGFMHLGGIYAAFISERFAHQSGGVFYLRIEDTDKKREIEGGISQIVSALNKFDISFDEGMLGETESESVGIYSPYRQSERVEIYHVFVKMLMEKGLAYPCFCNEQELNVSRAEQEELKLRTGYYSKWATCRSLTTEQAIEKINNGESYVVRLKSLGSEDNKVICHDCLRGEIVMPENDMDIVLLKTNGIPTYHFAHAVDDHLMRTTHVIRGDEWLSSFPIHAQLFEYLGFELPEYLHISPLMKLEENSKRKLSKRKDPEAASDYYHEMGYDSSCVMEYLSSLLNSNYEEWKKQNPNKTYKDFIFTVDKMSQSGALFDLMKLNDVSKNLISTYDTQTVFNRTYEWAKIYDQELYSLMTDHHLLAYKFLSIERGNEKPRKDIAKWSDVKDYMSYAFDELFNLDMGLISLEKSLIKSVLEEYITAYDENDDKTQWFDRLKDVAEKTGFAREVKMYKKEPEKYPGHVGDVSTIIRVAITGRKNTPDLCEILKVLGKERVIARLNSAIKTL